jgi:hypothetical protein
MNLYARIRPLLPTEARVLARRVRRLPERRVVRRNLHLSPSLTHSRTRRGSVWGVAMMHNEADTARHVVEHMLAQDVDAILVSDNNSTDETPDVLRSLSESHPVHVVQDHLTAYHQATKMTILADVARRCGADWIVPFDADELWFAGEQSVGSLLRRCDATVVTAEIHNVFPGSDDDADEPDPFLRLRHVDPLIDPVHKIAFRSHPLAEVDMGNQDVFRRGPRAGGLFIAHYPWRSFEQMAGKLRHGRQAMAATSMSDDHCYHWRIGGTWSDEQIARTWDDLRAGRFVAELSWSPLGTPSPASPGTASTWADIAAVIGPPSLGEAVGF